MLSKEDLGADKLIRMDLGDCEFYVAEIDNNDFLIAIYSGRKGYYAKISLPYSGEWDCEWILYQPEGLFAFAEDYEKLKGEIRSKLMELYDLATGKLRPYYQ
ncbi:MAG: hypothetical protein RXN77_00205 [Sulfolobaceae archaeon]|nr:hypothetical protein [Sulfolobales archaeon]